MTDWPWNALDLTGPAPLREVKRAYAKQLKAIDRSDPEAFQNLRDAFERAKDWAEAETPQPSAAAARPDLRQLAAGSATMPKVARLPKDAPPPPEPARAADEPQETPAAPPLPVEEPPAEPKADAPLAAPEEPALPEAQAAPPVSAFEITAFWEQFNALIAARYARPFDINKMRALLRNPAARLPDERSEVEWRLYVALDRYVEDVSRPLPDGLAPFLEEEFAWISDAAALRRVAGPTDRMHELTHVLHISMPREPQAAPSLWQKIQNAGLDWAAGLALACTLFLSWKDGQPYTFSAYREMFTANLIILCIGGLVAALGVSLTVFVLKLLKLSGPLYRLIRRVAPEFATKRMGSVRVQSVLGYIIVAALICLNALFKP